VPGAVRELVAAGGPGAPVLYAVAEHWGIYRSDDAAGWMPTSGLPRRGLGCLEVTSLAAAPDDPRLLLATLDQPGESLPELYRSCDGGNSWMPRRGLSGLTIDALTMAPGKAAYAACGRHLYFSPDAGDTWLRLGDHPAQARALVLVVDSVRQALYLGTEGEGLWVTTDQGASWSSALPGHTIWTLAVAGEGRMYAGAGDGLYLSEDGGASWQRLTAPELQESVREVAAGPDGEVAAATAGRSIVLSLDGGATWQRLPLLPVGQRATALLFHSGHLYVGTGQGVWRCRLPSRTQGIGRTGFGHASAQS
jgi:photosystem II stability/assembly factor-like uncharacterized protein